MSESRDRARSSQSQEPGAPATEHRGPSETILVRLGFAHLLPYSSRHGTILHDGQPVGETDYDIILTPPHLRGTAVTFEAGLPGTEPTNVPDVTGRLLGPLYQAEPYAEDVHTLVLNDGRLLDFRVIQPDTNEIVAVSWFRMP